jgi:hypothetical protein
MDRREIAFAPSGRREAAKTSDCNRSHD